MATLYGERHDSNQGAPAAKRRADCKQLEGQSQQAVSIVQHADVMAHLISFMNRPSDVARLLIATDRFKAPIMAHTSSICFTEHACCNIDIMKLAQKFVHLQSCVIECTNPKQCVSRVWSKKMLPRFALSLRRLWIPHAQKIVGQKLLGSRDRNLLESLYISSGIDLPFLPSLQRLHLVEMPNSSYFNDQLAKDLPLLETLLIGPCMNQDDVGKRSLNLQDFVNLRRFAIYIDAAIHSLQYITLPSNLERLTLTPTALARLKVGVYPNLTYLTVLNGYYDALPSPICNLSHMMPNLQSLMVNMRADYFGQILTLEADIPTSLPQLKEINMRLVATFPECWRYLAEMRDDNRQITLFADRADAYVSITNRDHYAYMPPFDEVSFHEVPLTDVPQESLHAAKYLSISSPYQADWNTLSNYPPSASLQLMSLSIDSINVASLARGNYNFAPLSSLTELSLVFNKFEVNCIKKLRAINRLVCSISSKKLTKLQIHLWDDLYEWYKVLAERPVSSVCASAISLPSLLQKHLLLKQFTSDLPVAGLDETDQPVFEHGIEKIEVAIWRGQGQVFNNDHYMRLMDHIMHKTGLTKLQKLSVGIVQPVWLAESKTARCISIIPSGIVNMHGEDNPNWKCDTDQYPCQYDPKYLLMRLKLKAGVTQTDMDSHETKHLR